MWPPLDKVEEVKEAIKAFEGAVGVDINKDFFSNFGDIVVPYSSPSDGFLGTGKKSWRSRSRTARRWNATLGKLIKAIPNNPAGEVTLKRKAYHGGEIIQLGLAGPWCQLPFRLDRHLQELVCLFAVSAADQGLHPSAGRRASRVEGRRIADESAEPIPETGVQCHLVSIRVRSVQTVLSTRRS